MVTYNGIAGPITYDNMGNLVSQPVPMPATPIASAPVVNKSQVWFVRGTLALAALYIAKKVFK